MDGFLCVDKPKDLTSRQVVNHVQRLVKPLKVGHAGTLDPMATGVLVVALGRATRLVPYVQQMTKHYEGEFLLGMTSDTEDVTGEVITTNVASPPSLARVESVCKAFVGEQLQRPPIYSALKVAGRRSYELARKQVDVQHRARPVRIHDIEIVRYAFPELGLRVVCGSGTYIRSLGRDIGERLDCGAVMSQLRRTAIGEFSLGRSVTLTQLDDVPALQRFLCPAAEGVRDLPQVQLDPREVASIRHGGKLVVDGNEAVEIAALDDQSRLVAVLSRTREGDYRPAVNFVAQ